MDVTTSGSFASYNTGIATVGASSGYASLVAPGKTTLTSHLDFWQMVQFVGPCILSSADGSADTTVTPRVSITSALNFAFVGLDPTVPRVAQQAVGNPGGGMYSWSASPANRVSFDNPSADVVRVSGINPSTQLTDTTLTVNYRVNNQDASPPATRAITVRIFRFLQQSGQIQIISFNGPSTFGYEADVFYNIFTNPGGQVVEPGFSGIRIPETLNILSVTVNGQPADIPFQLQPGTGATNSNSQIVDQLRLLSSQPLPSGLDITVDQNLFAGGFFVRNNTLHFLTDAPTITNKGPFN